MNNTIYKFNIEVNRAGQRVVIIDDKLVVNNCEPIKYEDFDAVLYKTEDIRTLIYQFTNILNVFSNNAFQFKPFFLNSRVTRNDLISSCDGLADDINSPLLIDETSRIQRRMIDLGFKHFEREPSFWNNDNYFYAFVRFGLSRGDILPKMEVVKGSPFGYIHPIMYVMFRSLNISAAEFLSARSKFHGDFQYVEPVDLVGRVHVCPSCYDKGLLYMETCPKCGSIDVEEQNMIHHFRCANISPEQTYVKDGKLICPKCMRELHHIGVDYDRPTTSFTCNTCNINFSNSTIICECETCGAKSPSEKLVPIKMCNMMINERGKKMLPITDYIVNADSVAKYQNILSFNQFKEILSVRLGICASIASTGHTLRVYRAIIGSEAQMDSVALKLISTTYSLLPSANISSRKNVLYLMVESKTGSEAERNLEVILKEIEVRMLGNVVSVDYLEYDGLSSIDEFIALI